ncbi:uncharacterized protein METZ01_LOCUS99761, partial [marine metagenome]
VLLDAASVLTTKFPTFMRVSFLVLTAWISKKRA